MTKILFDIMGVFKGNDKGANKKNDHPISKNPIILQYLIDRYGLYKMYSFTRDSRRKV